jgi:hypothetical protein
VVPAAQRLCLHDADVVFIAFEGDIRADADIHAKV